MLNPDTHILLHALHGRLEPREQKLLTEDGDWAISAIVLWEIEKFYQKGRIVHGLDYAPLQAALRRMTIWPITPEVCLHLRGLDLTSDLADGLIVVTRDARILSSRIVPCL